MAPWMKALAAKLDDPSSIPATHLGGENKQPQAAL